MSTNNIMNVTLNAEQIESIKSEFITKGNDYAVSGWGYVTDILGIGDKRLAFAKDVWENLKSTKDVNEIFATCAMFLYICRNEAKPSFDDKIFICLKNTLANFKLPKLQDIAKAATVTEIRFILNSDYKIENGHIETEEENTVDPQIIDQMNQLEKSFDELAKSAQGYMENGELDKLAEALKKASNLAYNLQGYLQVKQQPAPITPPQPIQPAPITLPQPQPIVHQAMNGSVNKRMSGKLEKLNNYFEFTISDPNVFTTKQTDNLLSMIKNPDFKNTLRKNGMILGITNHLKEVPMDSIPQDGDNNFTHKFVTDPPVNNKAMIVRFNINKKYDNLNYQMSDVVTI